MCPVYALHITHPVGLTGPDSVGKGSSDLASLWFLAEKCRCKGLELNINTKNPYVTGVDHL